MLGQTVLHDLDVDGLISSMRTYTTAGRNALRERLSTPLTDSAAIEKRQAQLKAIKQTLKSEDVNAMRTILRDTEEDVLSVMTASDDERHAEYYTQILWPAKSRFAWLNGLGWLNEAIVFFRTIFLPGLSILLPLIVFIAPLVFYTLIIKEPLTVKGYFNLLQSSLKKAMPSVLGKPRFAGTGGAMEVGEQFAHVGVSIAMFVASIWNQISAAVHMRTIVDDMRRRADSVHRFAKAVGALGAALGVPVQLPALPEDHLGLFGDAWNSPERIKQLMDTAGELDMLAAVATLKRTCFPAIGHEDHRRLQLTDLYHPAVQPSKRVYNSLTMASDVSGCKTHVLLTGPNRGGKSTLLKSLGCAVLMAQTVGVVFARSAVLPVFDNIITALAPQDVIGKLSLFEAEIEFAKSVKALVGRTFLMMDEIFHGTNAHDGVEASQVFLDDLYSKGSTVFSVVSTHYMDLPTRYGAPGLSQNLCMEASEDATDPDRLIYTYRLKNGVNRFSSVREILKERGLLGCGPAPEKTTTETSKV